ncbi:hypothetical protein L1049_010662 [Liquidambar formosana]|uniref:Uncharacterized protein n=1 Tax=Liquidambar formosana TaxID=63359 RepID=A0AAP0NBW7_LIQFO
MEWRSLSMTLKPKMRCCWLKYKLVPTEHKEKKSGGGEAPGNNAALQERNKALSAHLLKSLDGYRSLKRKYREVQEENGVIQVKMEEMGEEIAAGLDRIRGFQHRMGTKNIEQVNVEDEISALEHMFECFKMKVSKHVQKKSECVQTKS